MENDNETLMIKGFNAGYILQKHNPELAKEIRSNLERVNEPYVQGFLAGAKEYEVEMEREKSQLFPGMEEGFDQDFSDLDLGLDKGDGGIDR